MSAYAMDRPHIDVNVITTRSTNVNVHVYLNVSMGSVQPQQHHFNYPFPPSQPSVRQSFCTCRQHCGHSSCSYRPHDGQQRRHHDQRVGAQIHHQQLHAPAVDTQYFQLHRRGHLDINDGDTDAASDYNDSHYIGDDDDGDDELSNDHYDSTTATSGEGMVDRDTDIDSNWNLRYIVEPVAASEFVSRVAATLESVDQLNAAANRPKRATETTVVAATATIIDDTEGDDDSDVIMCMDGEFNSNVTLEGSTVINTAVADTVVHNEDVMPLQPQQVLRCLKRLAPYSSDSD